MEPRTNYVQPRRHVNRLHGVGTMYQPTSGARMLALILHMLRRHGDPFAIATSLRSRVGALVGEAVRANNTTHYRAPTRASPKNKIDDGVENAGPRWYDRDVACTNDNTDGSNGRGSTCATCKLPHRRSSPRRYMPLSSTRIHHDDQTTQPTR